MNLVTYNELFSNIGKPVYIYQPQIDGCFKPKLCGKSYISIPSVSEIDLKYQANNQNASFKLVKLGAKGVAIECTLLRLENYRHLKSLYLENGARSYILIGDEKKLSATSVNYYTNGAIFIFTEEKEAIEFSKRWVKAYRKFVPFELKKKLYNDHMRSMAKLLDKRLQSIKVLRDKISELQSGTINQMVASVIDASVKSLMTREKNYRNNLKKLKKEIKYYETYLSKRYNK